MANRYLFAGGEKESITVTGGAPSEVTNGTYDAAYSRCAIQCGDASHNFSIAGITPNGQPDKAETGEDFWLHFHFFNTTGSIFGDSVLCYFRDNTGTAFFRIVWNGSLRLEYWNGSAWATIGSPFSAGTNALHTIDVRITPNGAGVSSATLYVGNSAVATGTFTNALMTDIRTVQFYGTNANGQAHYSQFLMTVGFSTIGAKVQTSAGDGAGNSNSFTSGVFGNINEIALNDTTNFISQAANQEFTIAMSNVTTPIGKSLKAVFVWARCKQDGAAPQNLQMQIRVGGTTYQSATVPLLDSGFAPRGAFWGLNPNTGAGWTDTIYNGAEVGAKSIT